MNQKKAYEKITNTIVEMMDRGTIIWRLPFNKNRRNRPFNPYTGTNYSGFNFWTLLATMIEREYEDPRFATFHQIKEAGGRVKRGEKSTLIFSVYPIYDDSENPEILYFRTSIYYLFNLAAQTTLTLEPLDEERIDFDPILKAESIVRAYQDCPPIKHSDIRQAFYHPRHDFIHIPIKTTFHSSDGYYATLFHEMVHSTGHKTRLARAGVMDFDRFGSDQYSLEELIAEFGSAYLCYESGISHQVIENQAAYIQAWKSKLKDNPKMIFVAAQAAMKAANYIQAQKQETTS